MNYPFDAAAQVQASAREWHKLQLGVLGFVGLCGVLRGDSGSGRPLWLQDLSGITALAGLVLALVAVTSSPLSPSRWWPSPVIRRPSRAGCAWGSGSRSVAVALTALSALSMWWPDRAGKQVDRASDQVTVTTSSGSACGTVLDSASGWLDLEVKGDRVRVPLNRLVSIRPVDDC
jgi:hypothetical protein